MVDIKTLLPELRKLVLALAEDLLARATTDKQINAGLREAFGQIEKGGRTALAFEVWRDDYLDQVAVAWVLACVFVRFMEDNHLIDECWLAGEGDHRKLAEDSHEIFFREHPHDTDREYFQHVFHEVGNINAAKDLFAEGKTPLWAVAPSGDAAMKLLNFWREMNAESGQLKRSFEVESGDTRFLGDLYQELSERAKKKFALLQTPVFVEEFILDRTLTPALNEFGLEQVRMIDPTCGSGHFLLGGFARLFREWCKRESNEIKAAQNALDGVWGVDINPFAVAIARFRLIVAAVQACGIKRLKQAPGWNIHLASGDSLLFGSKPTFDGKRSAISQQLDLFDVADIYAVEDRKTLQQILGQGYHVVVGNPPYIIVKDKAQNEAYRQLYNTCHRKYSLSVPFAQRFWELAIQQSKDSCGCGYVGQITANSFMKREFGKKLIGEFFPKIDLTHVIDTSGAYIPGHGTPTVILFGRARKPVGDEVRAVLGIKGEPATPEDPSLGLVWQSVVRQIDSAGAQDAFTNSVDAPRATFSKHPWSIGGGGVGDVKELLEEFPRLEESSEAIGFMAIAGDEDVYLAPSLRDLTRKGIATSCIRALVDGQAIRDWSVFVSTWCIFDYDQALILKQSDCLEEHFWPFRSLLAQAPYFGKPKDKRGLNWRDWAVVVKDKFKSPLSIFFANVATHNHFFLERGQKLGGSTVQVIKLSPTATESEYLGLLGLLNSSTACFWIKQVCHNKGSTVDQHGARQRTDPFEDFYQLNGTRIGQFPVPETKPHDLSARLDSLGQQYFTSLSSAVTESSLPTRETLISVCNELASIHGKLIALQEELDWFCYQSYGVLSDDFCYSSDDLPELSLGQRAFEIVMARQMAKGELRTTWFERHGSKPITETPTNWPNVYRKLVERRIELIETNKEIGLIEKPEYKRRWNAEPWPDQEQRALKNWLLDRLETPKYRKGTKQSFELITTSQMADLASADADFLQVAALYRGRPDFDVAALVAELVEGEVVPFMPILRYKPTGLRKREVWERMWTLQRQQDAGKDVGEIPVPPRYATADFVKTDFWKLRGKLDVPRERWISYPHCHTESDQSLVIGWAGWNHLQQATALVAYYDARKREGWDAKRLTSLLAGLDQLLPWIHQWHPEIDPEFGETAGQSYETMLKQDAHELGLTMEDIRNWEPPAPTTGRGRKRK